MRWLIVVALAGAVALAFRQWPVVTEVETGETRQYSDLQPWSYAAGEEQVRRAATRAVEKMDRWQFVGSGRGPGGSELRAVHVNPIPWFAQDVTVRMRSQFGRTRVSVRSRSRKAVWDLGQNARNIRSFRRALDLELEPR